MRKDYRLYIDDILEAIEKIGHYTRSLTCDAFAQDSKTVDAVLRNFEIIGEATKQIPEEIRNTYSDIPWREMARMRDKLIHNYFGVNLEVVWKTIQERIPAVEISIREMLAQLRHFRGLSGCLAIKITSSLHYILGCCVSLFGKWSPKRCNRIL